MVAWRFPEIHLPFGRDSASDAVNLALIVPKICPSCGASPDAEQFSAFGVCPSCGHHLRIPAWARIAQLADPGTFVEEDAGLEGDDPLAFQDTRPYRDRLAVAQEQTGLTEAVVVGRARLGGHRIAIAVFDFEFLGGSMGVAVGEKLVRLFERATERRQPVIVVATSGGARIQEGTVALSQMARVAAAVERHHAAGLLYLSVLADPTTGGVMVSPASLGDVVLAEPGAFAAFAGRRVASLSSAPEEPDPIVGAPLMSAEWLQTHGMVDAVVPRPALRETLAVLVDLLVHRNQPLKRPARSPYDVSKVQMAALEQDAWEAVQTARRADRPTALDYIEQITDHFVELHGDRLYGDDESIVCGVGTYAGQSVVFLGQERSRPAAPYVPGAAKRGVHPPGRPYPEGFRKVLRLALLAAKFGLPIVTLIDTLGAQADAETEGRGLAFAIGRCLRVFSALPVPVVAAIIGEGGSGAAIALAVADRVLMQERAVYEVISPEGAAAILYRDAGRAAELGERMHITAAEALALGVVDEIVPEPPGGAHTHFLAAADLLAESLVAALAESERWLPNRLVNQRYRRLRSIGTQYVHRRPSAGPAQPVAQLAPQTPALGVDS
jgi:acetyl-CoA carboxylase carboxyl transferase subunit beta